MTRAVQRRLTTALAGLLTVAVLTAGQQAGVAVSAAVSAAAPAGSGPITYAHDADGRLVATFDSTGAGVRYVYDANGNLTAARPLPADTLAVAAAMPLQGSSGTPVTIYGTGFTSATTVTFNGVSATVSSVTANRLAVTAPTGVSSGLLVVNQGTAAAAAGTFSLIAAAPTITAVSPTRVDDDGTLTLTGTGFDPTPSGNVVTVGGTRAVVKAATATSLSVAVPPFRPAGKVGVRTVNGIAISSAAVAAAPWPFVGADLDWVGTLAIGTATSVQVAIVNKVSLGLIDVSEGQRLAFNLSGSSFSDCADVKVYAPGDRIVDREQFCPGDTLTTAAVTAPTSGTYELLVAPSPGVTGAVTVTPREVPADATVRATLDAAAVTATTSSGGRAVFLLQAPANKRVQATLTVTGYNSCPAAALLTPSGATLISSGCLSSPTEFDALTLPVRGDYRLVVTPRPGDAGSVGLTVASVAGDATAGLTVGGPAVSVNTSSGQRAAFSFSGTAGARIYTQVSATLGGPCPAVTLRRPDGTPIKASTSPTVVGLVCTVEADTLVLPVTGVYTLLVIPPRNTSGSISGALFDVPVDATLITAADGTARSVTTSLGQNATVSFTASVGQRLFIKLSASWTNNQCRLSADLADPAGAVLTGDICADDHGYLETSALTTTGAYKLLLNPGAGAAGTTTITVTTIPADAVASTTIDGSASTVTTTAGQNGNVTFPAAAGQRVFVHISNTFGTSNTGFYELRAADGSSLASAGDVAGDGFIDATALLDTGPYTVTVNPSGAATGTSTVTVSSVPADANASTNVNGTPVALATTKAGQNAAITFAGTAGQKVRVTVTASSYTSPSDGAVRLLGPDGANLDYLTAQPGSTSDTALTATGTHQLTIDPYGSDTGSVTITIAAAPTLAPPSPAASAVTGSVRKPRNWPYATSLDPPKPGTSLTGTVKTTAGAPLPAVTLRIGTAVTRTGTDGTFSLTHLPAGTRSLLIDGRSASHAATHYGAFRTIVRLGAGQVNRLGFTSYLPALDLARQVSVRMPLARPLVLRTPAIPGLEVHLPTGTSVYDADGQPATALGITPIPLTHTPVPLPTGVKVPVFYTIQPAGGTITGGRARISYPNYLHLPPGARVNFWHDAVTDDDRDGWQTYGHGVVDSRGQQIVPEPGLGIADFNGAMINIPGQPPSPNPPQPCNCGSSGDPVDLATGLFTFNQTDLAESDTLPLALTRGYASGDPTDRAFGVGTNDLFSGFISSDTDEFTPDGSYADAELNGPDGSQIRFTRISPGTSFADAVMLATGTPSGYQHSVLAWNGDGFDVAMPDGTVYVYGDHMPLQAILDRHGNTLQVLREFPTDSGRGSGNVVAVRSPNGRWLRYTYDADDQHVTAVTDSAGRSVHYGYDTTGHLTTVTDPMGRVTTYGYDNAGRMTTVKDARDITYLTNTYGADNRVSRQTFADSSTIKFIWTIGPSGTVTAATATDQAGVVHSYVYDADGFLAKQTDGVGTTLARTTTITRDSGNHLPTAVTDPLGRTTKVGYDADGNVTMVTRAFGTTNALATTASYDGSPYPGAVASTTDALGNVTCYTYNAAGDLTAVTDPLGRTATATYAPDGRPLSSTHPGTPTVSFDWTDAILTEVTAPLGRTLSLGYDNADRRTAFTDAFGNTARTSYDADGEVLSTTTPLGRTTTLAYDPNGNPTRLTDPAGHATGYTYDAMDRPTARTDPLGAGTHNTYDLAGRLASSTNRRGQATVYEYDGLGRLRTVTYGRTGTAPNYTSESTLTYTYDAGNRLRTVTDSTSGAGPLQYSYDPLDRILGEATATGNVTYGYDAAGRRTSMTAPGASAVTATYDKAGQLTGVTQGGTTASFGYDMAGRRTSETLPGGVKASLGYDAASDLVSLSYTAAATGAALQTLTYSYDSTGRRAGVGGTSARTTLPSAWSATYDANDRLTALGAAAYSYDADGNRIGGAGLSYTWNARGQLTAVTAAGSTTTLRYDPAGRLLSLTHAGMTTAYRYDGARTLAEMSSASPTGTVSASYLRSSGVDRALTRTTPSGTATLLPDALGSTTAVAVPGAAGAGPTVETQYSYEPFGKTSSTSAGDPNPIRYTGRDASPVMPASLQYNRNRFYDPSTGRFLSQDPLGFGGGETNLYAYAAGDPVDNTDPNGTDILGGCVIGAVVGVAGEALSGRKHSLSNFAGSALKGCVVGVVATTIPFLLGEVLAIGEAGAAVEAVAAEDAITIYRGTANVAENQIVSETGMAMSDAARVGYVESGGSVDAAMAASEEAHANGIAAWGSEDAYAQAHAEFGTELSEVGPRSMSSFTTDPAVAKSFAGPNGTVYQAIVRAGEGIWQSLPSSTECEVLIQHMIEVTPWGG